jgi:uncharacterized protein YndB with AHSA1/START domain
MATIDDSADLRAEIERVIPAPRERVFAAWTDPEIVAKWWGMKSMVSKDIRIDLRAGGAYRYEMLSNEGNTYAFFGTFLEVDPPKRLVQTWEWEQGPCLGVEMRVTVEFLDEGTKTRVRIIH